MRSDDCNGSRRSWMLLPGRDIGGIAANAFVWAESVRVCSHIGTLFGRCICDAETWRCSVGEPSICCHARKCLSFIQTSNFQGPPCRNRNIVAPNVRGSWPHKQLDKQARPAARRCGKKKHLIEGAPTFRAKGEKKRADLLFTASPTRFSETRQHGKGWGAGGGRDFPCEISAAQERRTGIGMSLSAELSSCRSGRTGWGKGGGGKSESWSRGGRASTFCFFRRSPP